MLATLSHDRMNLPYTGRDPMCGKRKYLQIFLPGDELERVREAMLHALGLGFLIKDP